MSDLKTFTRDLIGQMEKDLGTKLDWVGVDHWNTEHPHVHLIVRGVRDDGQDLVISRDYIKEGMRDRARISSPRNWGRAPISRSAATSNARSRRALDQPRPPARRDAGAPASSISPRTPTASPTNSMR
jgi:type IV secretory pathway VirD2 relaxase